jgi:putative nucleotidyltransferase with HDIG domain
LLFAFYGLLMATALAAAIVTSRAADWHPAGLGIALLVMAVASDALILRVRNLRLSGAFAAMVLAMALLGPGPAIVIGLVTIGVDAIRSRLGALDSLANLTAHAWFTLIGGLLLRDGIPVQQADAEAIAVVLAVFMLTNVINFLLVWICMVEAHGRTWLQGIQSFIPVLPVQLAMGLLTAGVLVLERHGGPATVALLAGIVLVFQWLARIAIAASERGEEVQERNRQLASLQMGLISTVLKTLSLRDHMTARHSAAVARYSRAIAEALGLDEREQELIHTAALFHDIGKFIFPDRILVASNKLTDEDFDIVRKHPEVGADLISGLEGYGPVAALIRHHHERIDGRGYPDRIAGDDIPLGSRIMSVADVYDVITARDTYRTPVSMKEAFAELRRSAGSQLDAHLVEVFIDLVQSRGVAFRHSTAADFEAELALEGRAWQYAEPLRIAA